LKPGNASAKFSDLRHAFDSYNIQRVYNASSNFNDDEQSLFSAVPVLLFFNFNDVEGLECPKDAICGISSWEPKESHMAGFNRFFQGVELVKSEAEPAIISLMLVGSLGTVGQTEKSDFDYVVIVDKSRLSESCLESFQKKLSSIEDWAMREHGLEVHFFISDLVEFRENRFGETDRENVGTALGRLFKDEFYRTAIFIAGKRPLWWIVPPGLLEEKYSEFVDRVMVHLGREAENYVDLGYILKAEPQEFFGGALWQMNKAIGSPFKSVLKMGLLECYLLEPEKGLLCDELKKEILKSGESTGDIDPYRMMFERVVRYYQKNGMKKEVQLMCGAFLLKLGFTPEKADLFFKGDVIPKTGRERIITELLAEWKWSSAVSKAMSEDFGLAVDRSYQALGAVNRYFLDTYIRLANWLKEHSSEAVNISKTDMAVLGRKLFTYFEKRPGKISFMYPGAKPSTPPSHITLVAETGSSGERVWSLYNFQMLNAVESTYKNISKPIAQFGSLIGMLAWMAINGIWNPDTRLNFFGKVPLYSFADVSQILAGMYRFFVSDAQPEPERKDYIADKYHIKVFVVPNFGYGKIEGEMKRVDLVLLDSWGEYTYRRLKPREAYREINEMKTTTQTIGRKFSMHITVPDSQNDPMMKSEIERGVDMAEKISRSEHKKSGKARLDL